MPYYCFHDRDVAPEGATPRESVENLRRMVDVLGEHQVRTGLKVLWGTAHVYSHRRFMSGAATNPDPEIFALAALQVREAMNATQRLGGENYVIWGGREGYETLLNTDMKLELDNLGRFLAMAVEHKHKIGLKGPILIEPKPREPTKHQYDFDVATVYGFLKQYGLEKEVKVNIEANHATLAGHSFHHEIATAVSLGIFGSIDANGTVFLVSAEDEAVLVDGFLAERAEGRSPVAAGGDGVPAPAQESLEDVAEVQPLADRLGSERREQRAEHRAVLEGAERPHVELGHAPRQRDRGLERRHRPVGDATPGPALQRLPGRGATG